MKRIIIRYNGESYKVNVSEDNTCILDSYRVKSKRDMDNILHMIIYAAWAGKPMAIHRRSVSSMIKEWRVHNLLYSLNIQRDRTGSVDLNTGQPWYVRAAYSILSPFYLHFS